MRYYPEIMLVAAQSGNDQVLASFTSTSRRCSCTISQLSSGLDWTGLSGVCVGVVVIWRKLYPGKSIHEHGTTTVYHREMHSAQET